ncbi:nitroreductase family protein [Cohnella hongkongensis]|uniref:Nitroreductase family protein n=1 Tax=Cohnella hongkongensis TaxID=178337 RepID=A0ABV9FDP2_9BACL
MGNFEDVVKSRRSAMKFVPGADITEQELSDMFSLAKFAPSAFNLQHTHYVVVQDPEIKNKLHEAANKQFKVLTSSAVLIVLGHTKAYEDVGAIHEGLLNLGVMSKQEYDMTVESVLSFYRERGEAFQREEAIRNASLSAMLFMLIAKDRGWDTCPMIGFDPGAVAAALKLPETYVPALMITIGKEDSSSQRPRGYRKPVGEFVSYDTF